MNQFVITENYMLLRQIDVSLFRLSLGLEDYLLPRYAWHLFGEGVFLMLTEESHARHRCIFLGKVQARWHYCYLLEFAKGAKEAKRERWHALSGAMSEYNHHLVDPSTASPLEAVRSDRVPRQVSLSEDLTCRRNDGIGAIESGIWWEMRRSVFLVLSSAGVAPPFLDQMP